MRSAGHRAGRHDDRFLLASSPPRPRARSIRPTPRSEQCRQHPHARRPPGALWSETKPTRDLIRSAVAFRIEQIWPAGGSSSGFSTTQGTPPVEEIENQILSLSPETDSQRWLKAEALKLSEEIVKTRWRALGATGGSVPYPFLIAVIFWLTVTFASFGLYAPRNATVIAVLFVAALSVAAAVFLILELDGPFDGVIKVSSRSLRYALTELRQYQ